jgi:hypothetical protein
MTDSKDVFTGHYSMSSNSAEMPFDTFVAICKTTQQSLFMKDLGDLLKSHSRQLTLTSESPNPAFFDLLDCIDSSLIIDVDIFARSHSNPSAAVKTTLACDIRLKALGVLTVAPQWCAYKDQRADDMVASLLAPLYLTGLNAETRLRSYDGETQPLCSNTQNDHEQELRKVFKMAQYFSTAALTSDGLRRLEQNVLRLQIATEVFSEGVTGLSASNLYQDRLYSALSR